MRLLRIGFIMALLAAGPLAAAVPSGFTDVLVTNVGAPTALAFTPDGRLLITTQTGTLRIYQNGTLLATPALTFPASSICTNSERGLLGVAVHPGFASNRFIYLFYTFEKPGGVCVNRVSRFTLPDGNVISLASELVLVDNMPSPAGNHNAGDVHFGKDGYLYISIGDGGCDYANNSGCAGQNDAARDQHVLTGKILRVTDTGGIPPTNPFQGAGTARCNVTGQTTAGNRCQETFAWGLRNPFRIAFDPNAAGTRFFINDVGQGLWEEIDEAQAGADYGWNICEGAHANNSTSPCPSTPPGMVNPIYDYRHGAQVPGTTSPTSCNSITGGAFVPNGLWPGYDNSYLFSDFVCGWIFKLTGSGATWSAADFATSLGGSSAVHLVFGPHGNGQALYYTTYAGGGQVRRISYNVPGNEAPTAVASGSPLSGPAPLTVTFNATGSSDPDPGDTLTYFWDFGDGTVEASTTSLTIQHTYSSAGVFQARLRARDNDFAFSAPVFVTVQPGNTPPSPSISSPSAVATFGVGEMFHLVGSAGDSQDGTLPAGSLSWTIVLHHNDHTHPFLGPVSGNNIPFTAPAPEDLAATDASYLEIRLTATDSGGLSSTVTRDFQPAKVQVTLATDPTGLELRLNGSPITAPLAFTSWRGYPLNVGAETQTGTGGELYVLASWSDGGDANRVIVTPSSPATYTAAFQLAKAAGPLDFFTVEPCRRVDTRDPVGPFGGPALAAGEKRLFDLAGSCGVPVTAKAVAVNLTVVDPGALGHLQIFPADEAGTATSAINFRAGITRANNAILFLGEDGDVAVSCVLPSGSVHMVLDVVGYFE